MTNTKPPYYRIFLKEGDGTYLLCRLWQQKSDESLMLQVQPSKTSDGGRMGKIKITGDMVDIHFDQIATPANIEHTSIHATGQSHTKLKDGTLSINYTKDGAGIPLAGLKTIKHLGTLISRDMGESDLRPTTRGTDVSTERGMGQKFSVLDFLAIPKAINLHLTADWDMENDRPVQMTVALHRLGFNGFDVIVLARSSDQFEKLPAKTLHLDDMNNIVPFVVKLDETKATIKLSALKFEQILVPQGGANPPGAFIAITASPKNIQDK